MKWNAQFLTQHLCISYINIYIYPFTNKHSSFQYVFRLCEQLQVLVSWTIVGCWINLEHATNLCENNWNKKQYLFAMNWEVQHLKQSKTNSACACWLYSSTLFEPASKAQEAAIHSCFQHTGWNTSITVSETPSKRYESPVESNPHVSVRVKINLASFKKGAPDRIDSNRNLTNTSKEHGDKLIEGFPPSDSQMSGEYTRPLRALLTNFRLLRGWSYTPESNVNSLWSAPTGRTGVTEWPALPRLLSTSEQVTKLVMLSERIYSNILILSCSINRMDVSAAWCSAITF